MLLNSNVQSFQPTLAPQPFEPRLGHLPTEILLVIIELVARFVPRELEIIGDEKSKHLVWQQDLGATKSVWTYRQPDCPILNSLQALSVVNKRLNYLCRSVLWRALHFPSSRPIAMSHWDGLMHKYGDHVQSLTIHLSRDWLAEPWKRPYSMPPRRPMKQRMNPTTMPIHERDNLATRDRKATDHTCDMNQPLSRENVYRLIAQCPNLTSLITVLDVQEISRGYVREKSLSPISGQRLRRNLASLLTRLGGIRHLDASGVWTKLPARCIIDMAKQLPLLESLSCSGISSDTADEVIDFGISLSGHRNITNLSIHSTETLNTSKGFYPTEAPKITNLKIEICQKLLMSQTPSLISTWTPNLTHLTLHVSCFYPPSDYMEDIEAFHPNKHQFNLPELIYLKLWHEPKCDYLQCFRECKKIRHLTYRHIKKEACAAFHEFVVSNYPQLNTLRLNILSKGNDDDYYTEQSMEDHVRFVQIFAPLDDFCRQKRIHFEP